jgi:hypothetical protein
MLVLLLDFMLIITAVLYGVLVVLIHMNEATLTVKLLKIWIPVFIIYLVLNHMVSTKQKLKVTKEEQSYGAGTMIVFDEDRWFLLFDNGVVKDKRTGLEWIAGPDKETTWSGAKSWIAKINKHEFSGGHWRMPTIEELKTLYRDGVGTRNMSPLLKTTGWWVWSGEVFGSMPYKDAWVFNFKNGYDVNVSCFSSYESYFVHRVFAVRFR